MTRPENRTVDATVTALESLANATDAQTEQALNAARSAALAHAGSGHRKFRHSTHWLWAMGSAVILVLVVGIYAVDRNGEDAFAITEQLVADAELYQDMEFYTWLSEELESE